MAIFKRGSSTTRMQVDDQLAPRSGSSFDTVAIAASAGGLRALSEILAALPADFPAALVVVQHLDPRHRSLMADILSKHTAISVSQAREAERLQPGHAY